MLKGLKKNYHRLFFLFTLDNFLQVKKKRKIINYSLSYFFFVFFLINKKGQTKIIFLSLIRKGKKEKIKKNFVNNFSRAKQKKNKNIINNKK